MERREEIEMIEVWEPVSSDYEDVGIVVSNDYQEIFLIRVS